MKGKRNPYRIPGQIASGHSSPPKKSTLMGGEATHAPSNALPGVTGIGKNFKPKG